MMYVWSRTRYVHETTISSRQPGALISMHIPVANKTAAQIQRERVASTSAGSGGAAPPSPPALSLEAKVRRLDGGGAMLAVGKSAEEVLAAYSRHSIIKALAQMRQRTLDERSCGVRDGATWCVGEWCARADSLPPLG